MNKMILGLAGMMAVSAFVPSAAQAQRWDDGYYGKHDRDWSGDNGRHRGWDKHRGWRGDRGWDRGPRWRTACEWRGYYHAHRVCYRVRAW